ncbi:MAG TPA: NAD(P)-dependent alcohol dehydrogenase, partial [Pilimelia sp.]|nr:NAD(P)-dependent alcohol dehydrogenase [Pilimelia sp.]
MKAIVQDVYGSADVLHLRDIDKPVVGDRDVLVQVRAAGVDPSVWHLMSGQPYLIRLMGFGLRRPKHQVRGWDVAGTVEAVGGHVTRFRPGDEVFGSSDGGFAEYARAAEDKIVTKPAAVSFEQAAALPTSAMTAVQALRDRGRLASGQHVLVIGAAGGVGTFAVQIAAAMGARVTGVCSTAKMDLVRSIGAADVIDYTTDDFTDGTRRFDLILDNAGNRPLAALRRALTPAGTLVLIGGEGGGPWLAGLHRNIGAALLTPLVKQRLVGLFARAKAADLEYIRDLVEAGKVTPVIDRTFPLAQAPEA